MGISLRNTACPLYCSIFISVVEKTTNQPDFDSLPPSPTTVLN